MGHCNSDQWSTCIIIHNLYHSEILRMLSDQIQIEFEATTYQKIILGFYLAWITILI